MNLVLVYRTSEWKANADGSGTGVCKFMIWNKKGSGKKALAFFRAVFMFAFLSSLNTRYETQENKKKKLGF